MLIQYEERDGVHTLRIRCADGNEAHRIQTWAIREFDERVETETICFPSYFRDEGYGATTYLDFQTVTEAVQARLQLS